MQLESKSLLTCAAEESSAPLPFIDPKLDQIWKLIGEALVYSHKLQRGLTSMVYVQSHVWAFQGRSL